VLLCSSKPAHASTLAAVATVSLYSPPGLGVSSNGNSWTVMPVTAGLQLTGCVTCPLAVWMNPLTTVNERSSIASDERRTPLGLVTS
jgi:hypothetical protein